MKPLLLSEEHRRLLIIMCSVLFPYEEFKFGTKWDRDLIVCWDEQGMPYEIHWFEFMMTELVEKLFNPKPDHPNRGLQDRMKQFFWQVNIYWWDTKNGKKSIYDHPIDELYKLFKKQHQQH